VVWPSLVGVEMSHLVWYCQDGAKSCRVGSSLANVLAFHSAFCVLKVRIRESAAFKIFADCVGKGLLS
jgi:hypothetical protein